MHSVRRRPAAGTPHPLAALHTVIVLPATCVLQAAKRYEEDRRAEEGARAAADAAKRAALGSWEWNEGSGYYYNAVQRWYYDTGSSECAGCAGRCCWLAGDGEAEAAAVWLPLVLQSKSSVCSRADCTAPCCLLRGILSPPTAPG